MTKKSKKSDETAVGPVTDNNPDMKKYGKLLGTVDYDHEAAEQLASAVNEVKVLETRISQLRGLVEENKELHQFVWTSQDGLCTPLHKLEDDHLSNIMLHLVRNTRAVSKAIRGEAMRRNLVIPGNVPVDWNSKPGISGRDDDADDDGDSGW